MSVNSKMTAIADKIRTLLGFTGTMGLDAMANHLGDAVTEVDNQNGIIAQLKDAIAENVSKTSSEVSEQTTLIQQLKDAIAENVSKTSNEVSEQTTLIQQIKTALDGKAAGGGVQLPALTNPGAASDLAQGKQLIDGNGNVVEGVIPVVDSGNESRMWSWDLWDSDVSQVDVPYVSDYPGCAQLFARVDTDVLIKQNSGLYVYAQKDMFGDAQPGDVVQGKIFTSAAGVRVNGSVPVAGSEYIMDSTGPWTGDGVISLGSLIEENVLLKKGTEVWVDSASSVFGNARPEDVAQGKTFTSAAGIAVEGTGTSGGGFAIKTGTTTSRTINTGLSDIEQFFIYKESQTSTGLIRLHYTKTATSRMYASAWSTNNYGTKTITNGTGGASVNGGTITISATSATSGGLSSNVTYKWIAVGTE